ncbi:MAG: hypothetical protein JSV52_00570 [Candidatus Zixiibacteriota bacterium]|nr:MAG: hypothetical protein JSV52_00570 [candidate division Zixibacteria bacterium]
MATKAKKNTDGNSEVTKWPYGKNNYIVFALALLVIILGFYTLSTGSITLAPILLVLGYCVLLPIALIIKANPEEDRSPQADQS